MSKPPYIHPQALNESRNVGPGTRIWAFAHVLPGAKIGSNCNICDHVFIENNVIQCSRGTDYTTHFFSDVLPTEFTEWLSVNGSSHKRFLTVLSQPRMERCGVTRGLEYDVLWRIGCRLV